jgi:hypothetical protein
VEETVLKEEDKKAKSTGIIVATPPMAAGLPPHHPVCFRRGKQQPFLPHPGINGAHPILPLP